MGAFQVTYLHRSAAEAWAPFANAQFKPYRDACTGPCTYDCTILHCLRALERAIGLGWFDCSTFNCAEYEHFERVENGDFNWIIPNKLLAFSAPVDDPSQYPWKVLSSRDYAELFKQFAVTAVVRLNEKTYDEKNFLNQHIAVYDMFFMDGSTPSSNIVENFLAVAKQESVVAVHCKAGLGRTGTLIACYAIQEFGFPVEEIIAWCRICRPGSVLGPQQHFLFEFQQQLCPTVSPSLAYSPLDKHRAEHGDSGQAALLLSAKHSSSLSKT